MAKNGDKGGIIIVNDVGAMCLADSRLVVGNELRQKPPPSRSTTWSGHKQFELLIHKGPIQVQMLPYGLVNPAITISPFFTNVHMSNATFRCQLQCLSRFDVNCNFHQNENQEAE